MPEVARVEDPPTEIRTHTVWLRPAAGEDWGDLRDDVYHDKRFRPNMLCVIVTESSGQVHATWSQAREELDDGMVTAFCRGTQVRGDDRYTAPDWWRAAEDYAEDHIRQLVRARV